MTSSQGIWVWRKSSFSEANGNSECVEIAFAPDRTAIRDSKNRDSGMLILPPAAWETFRTTAACVRR